MRIHIIAIGNRMDHWVNEGYREFAKRLPKECSLSLHEIPAIKRSKQSDIQKITQLEGQRMLDAVPKGANLITLDLAGKAWDTKILAQRLASWLRDGRDVALLIGGPEGLSDECKMRAEVSWCLSNLTLPHPLVRVIVAEQLYRAWSILNNHPYHR